MTLEESCTPSFTVSIRRPKRRMLSIAAVSVVLVGMVPQDSACGDTFVWVGNSPETTPADTSGMAALIGGGWSAPATSSNWSAGFINKPNWSVNGSTPTTIPGPDDTVVFGTGFSSGNPYNTTNRAIYELQFDTNQDFYFSSSQGGTKFTTTIVSGRVTRTNTSSGNQLIQSNIAYGAQAIWDLGGTGSITLWGDTSTVDFIKRGTATLRLNGNETLLTGTTRIEDGLLLTLSPLLGVPSLVLGDGVGANSSAEYRPLNSNNFASIVIESDGSFNPQNAQNIGQLELRGGTLDAFPAQNGPQLYVTSGLVTARAAWTNSAFAPAGMVITDPERIGAPVLNFSNAPLGNGTIRADAYTFGDQTSVDALRIHFSVQANVLTFDGTGRTTFLDAQGKPANVALNVNSVGSTVVKGGELHLSRTADHNVVGSTLTIGQASGPAALVHATKPEQITDAATVIVNATGMYTLAANANERISQLVLAGGAVDTGTSVLTLTAPSTTITGTTSTLSGIVNFNGQTHSLELGTGVSAVADAAFQNGTLRKRLGGQLTLGGAADNTVSETVVEAGTLLLNKTAGRNAVGAQLTIGTGTPTTPLPNVRWLRADQIPDTQVVAIHNGTLDLNGYNETISGTTTSGLTSVSIQTGAGTLALTGATTAFEGSVVTATGNFNLAGGARSFYAFGNASGQSAYTNYVLSGTLNNGTFVKQGVGRVRLDNVTGNAVLQTNAGLTQIGTASLGGLTGAYPVQIDTSFTVSTPNLSTQVYTGSLSGSGKLVKSGNGTLSLGTFTNSLAGGVELDGGTLELTSPTALGTAPPKLGAFDLLRLNLPGRSYARFTHGPSTVVSGSYISLSDDALIVDYSGATLFNTYRQLVILNRNNGTWNNLGGIGSILAGNDPSNIAVGVIEASSIFAGPGPFTWRGQSVDATSLLFAATILGDANLDLAVNFDDLLALAQNYSPGVTGKSWAQGDFDYNGSVDFNDLLAMAQHYGSSLLDDASLLHATGSDFARDLALAQSLVPEPTAIVILGLATGIVRRRR